MFRHARLVHIPFSGDSDRERDEAEVDLGEPVEERLDRVEHTVHARTVVAPAAAVSASLGAVGAAVGIGVQERVAVVASAARTSP